MLPSSQGFVMSHAPIAPYAGAWAGSTHGYRDFMLEFQDDIDFIALQYYNNIGVYETYAGTFTANTGVYAGSTIKELIDAGIKPDKLVVGKPAGDGTASSGYMSPAVLQTFGCRAKADFGFVGGYMTWMYRAKRQQESREWAAALTSPCKGEAVPQCKSAHSTKVITAPSDCFASWLSLPVTCAEAGFYRHSADCTKYHLCEYSSGSYQKFTKSCEQQEGQQLYWRHEDGKMRCDWPSEVSVCCDGSNPSGKDSGNTDNSGGENGGGSGGVSAGVHKDKSTVTTCDKHAFHKHEDCTKYIQCMYSGDTVTSIEVKTCGMKDGKQLKWLHEKSWCDFPENVATCYVSSGNSGGTGKTPSGKTCYTNKADVPCVQWEYHQHCDCHKYFQCNGPNDAQDPGTCGAAFWDPTVDNCSWTDNC